MSCNPSPPEKIIAFKEGNIRQVPEAEGVLQLYDEDRNLLAIRGAANLRKEILLALKAYDKGAWFDFEEDKMYSNRESELIQRYLQEHGKMPGAGTDDEDLF
jgi:formate dehydrogenase beta subunit